MVGCPSYVVSARSQLQNNMIQQTNVRNSCMQKHMEKYLERYMSNCREKDWEVGKIFLSLFYFISVNYLNIYKEFMLFL